MLRNLSILKLLNKKDIDAFWDRVQVGKKDECWPWIGAFTNGGQPLFISYGRGKKSDRIQMQGRRVAWALVNNEEPSAYLLSTCGNDQCVNPAHLEPRQLNGEDFDAWLKFTGLSRSDAASALGVSPHTIDAYVTGRAKPKYATLVLMQLIADGEDPTPWPRAA